MRVLILALLMGGAAQAWTPPYDPPLVVSAHDREPLHESRGVKDTTPVDNECNENHHLMPDGDADCDDPKTGVPEPATLGLLALGLMGLYVGRKR